MDPIVKVAAQIPVSRSLLDDAAPMLSALDQVLSSYALNQDFVIRVGVSRWNPCPFPKFKLRRLRHGRAVR